MNLRRSSNLSQTFIQTAIILPFVAFVYKYLDAVLTFSSNLDEQFDRASLLTQNQDSVFDYIIVGAGSAGAIVACRLAENSSVRVLLLEAGGTPSPIEGIPTLAFLLSGKQPHNWRHRTVPQKNAAFGLNEHVVHWHAGKALGGSSAINGLINIRGNIQGYDRLAKRTGDPIWKSENILEFYKKVEKYEGWFSKDLHGTKGDLVMETPDLVPLTRKYLEAGREMGYPTRDPNVNTVLKEGFAPVEFYTEKGVRADAYRSTLRKHLFRKNLVVRKFSFVTRLLFAPGSKNEVTGVEYERHGQVYTAKANLETILSAGTLSTPKILMLSGIGPKQHLDELNIKVRLDLPVGQRLQDKYGALIGPFVVARGQSFNQERDITASTLFNWVAHGKGYLNSARTEATFAILSQTAKQSGDTYAPDMHTYLLSQTPVKAELNFGHVFNFNPTSLEYMTKSLQYGDGFFQLATMSRAVGTGTLRLRDSNPHSPPVIDPKYLHHPHDVKILVEAIRFSVDVVDKTKAMREIGAQLFRLPFPGCEGHEFKSDAYYECLGRHATISAYKYCGTATIGTKDDPEAVVDSRFRVFGTERLRVIDGSLLRINEVNTNDVTMRMVGELGAHIVKLSWGGDSQ